jgi:hypothetical protein
MSSFPRTESFELGSKFKSKIGNASEMRTTAKDIPTFATENDRGKEVCCIA